MHRDGWVTKTRVCHCDHPDFVHKDRTGDCKASECDCPKFKGQNRNKYMAKQTEYRGRRYDSGLESRAAFELDMRKRAGEIISIRPQVDISLDVKGHHITTYRIDFVAERSDGWTEYIEAKGRETEVWKLKWKLFLALYGDAPKSIFRIQR